MNTIRQWIAARPWTAVGLSWFFGATAAVAGFRDDWLPYMIGLLIVGLFIMGVSMRRHATKLILLAALMVQVNNRAEERQAAPVGVAVVVVVVGGVCVYLLVRTCQKLFPKTPAPSTNSPPNVGGKSDDTAGSWTYSGFASCAQPMSEPQWPTVTMELSGTIESDGLRVGASRRVNTTELLQDYNAFLADLQRHGITIGPVGSMNYGRNGRPAYEQEVPIRFSEDGTAHVATVYSDSGPSVPMVIQRSFDMQTWTTFGHVAVPFGQKFKLVDTTTSQSAFYRVQPR